MMLTFYFNGKDQFLPNHQDKAVDYQSKGKVENKSQIFNFSFGAPRSLVVTDLASLGKSKREEMTIYGDFAMMHGDMFVLEPDTNATCAHGVPYDESASGLRVSLVLRHVSKHEVRLLASDPASPWEVRTRKPSGVWGKWENVKGAADGEPTDPGERLAHRREQAARILRRRELNARGTQQLREDLQERGLESKGQKKELIDRLMSVDEA